MFKKTMIIAAAVAATLATPMVASAQSRHHNDRDHRYERNDRRDNYRHDARRYAPPRYNDNRRYNDRRYNDNRRYDRHYRPAPPRYYRGGTLPYQYRSNWYIRDYNRYGYGPPPRGYGYYRTDTGDVVIAALATGVILSLLAN